MKVILHVGHLVIIIEKKIHIHFYRSHLEFFKTSNDVLKNSNTPWRDFLVPLSYLEL